MDYDSFVATKKQTAIGDARVAYVDEGSGPPLLLLHGCPFSSFVWRKVIPTLATAHRCLAPDLLGLGDTETAADADWSLPAQETMVVGLLDVLGLERVSVVGHDHGGAVARCSRPATRTDWTGWFCATPRPTTTGPRPTSGRSSRSPSYRGSVRR